MNWRAMAAVAIASRLGMFGNAAAVTDQTVRESAATLFVGR